MKLPWMALGAFCIATSLAQGAQPLYVTVDVPTTVSGGPTLMPWEIWRYDPTGPTYTRSYSVPGQLPLAAIHKLDAPGDWLFSVALSGDLAGALSAPADPRDVIRCNGGSGSCSLYFCGGAVGVPAGSRVDALYLEGGDGGPLIVSFDVSVTSGTFTFDPADLVRFVRSGAGCGGWSVAGDNPAFDASMAGSGIPRSDNVVGADFDSGSVVIALDVPTSLSPSSGPSTYMPGQLVGWNGTSYALYAALGGWPAGSIAGDFARLPHPGTVPPTVLVDKAAAPPGDIRISWSNSCSEGGEDYGIYEGLVGSWYSHTLLAGTDTGADRQEQVSPASGNRYYIVVPHNAASEGSYGRSKGFPPGLDSERPVGIVQAVAPQVLAPCP